MTEQHDMWESRAFASLTLLQKSFEQGAIQTVLREAMKFAGLMNLLYHATDTDGYLEAKMEAEDGNFKIASEWLRKAHKARIRKVAAEWGIPAIK